MHLSRAMSLLATKQLRHLPQIPEQLQHIRHTVEGI